MSQPNGGQAQELLYVGIRPEGIPVVQNELQRVGVDFSPFLGDDGLVQRARKTVEDGGRNWALLASEITFGIDDINEVAEGLEAQAFRVVTVRPILPNPYFDGGYTSPNIFSNDRGRSRYTFLGSKALTELGNPRNLQRYGSDRLSQLAIGVRATEPVPASTRAAYSDFPADSYRLTADSWI